MAQIGAWDGLCSQRSHSSCTFWGVRPYSFVCHQPEFADDIEPVLCSTFCTVPTLIFMTMYPNRHSIRKLGTDLQAHNSGRGTSMTFRQLAKSKNVRSSFATLSVKMAWLLPKFETFLPSFWFAGVGLLVLRLVQTTLMALVQTQRAQAAIVSIVTLVAFSTLRELSPMRRASDNRVLVLSQALIFS